MKGYICNPTKIETHFVPRECDRQLELTGMISRLFSSARYTFANV
jgi:hypothetical protein